MLRSSRRQDFLLEMWARRATPEPEDPRTVYDVLTSSMAAAEPDRDAVLALGWNLICDIYASLEWPEPVDPDLTPARERAAHQHIRALQAIATHETALTEGRHSGLVSDDLGCICAVTGRWDILAPTETSTDGPVLPAHHTAAATTPSDLKVRIPTLPAVAAVLAPRAQAGDPLAQLLVTGARHGLTTDRDLGDARRLARDLGTRKNLDRLLKPRPKLFGHAHSRRRIATLILSMFGY